MLAFADRLAAGRRTYVYLESPCNPHGYVLDVPGICRAAHGLNMRVILDATVGTPFLTTPLQRPNSAERPDFVLHSYTKDLSGTGSVIAGVVIGRNEDMFLPKGESAGGIAWNDTLFWNVYYVKGAFLNADAAFEVLQGLRTLEVRMLQHDCNGGVVAKFLAGHKKVKRVFYPGLPDHPQHALAKRQMRGFGSMVTFETGSLRNAKKMLARVGPVCSLGESLGGVETLISHPATMTHAALGVKGRAAIGITDGMVRISVGIENVEDIIADLEQALAAI